MGDPEFKLRELIKRENVRVFSSNYALYGDLSRRVGDTLGSMVPTIETYSIDESFLNLGEFNSREVEPLARELRERFGYRRYRSSRQLSHNHLQIGTPPTLSTTAPTSPKSRLELRMR